ncbi:MAG: Glu/Leu/Phe/Val dehydrogenase dimerization domain-containing protein [Nanoarchaeota archaeon]|nr:Glu/Leu/Phe/Val dehydrogenase dimerization domain-containing protein [Nanoarchaeota archaeon]
MVDITAETSIHDICLRLEELAKGHDDIFFLSFRADGESDAWQVLNASDGKKGTPLAEFSKLKDIVFTDTANQIRMTLMQYFKKQGFNPENGDGEIVVAYDGRTRTMHIIGVHNSNLGKAVGGLREKDYSTFDSMITDVLRLSRGMTYKAAAADTATGGGKGTRTAPKGVRTEANLSTGRICNFMNLGRDKRGIKHMVIAEDSNTTCNDVDEIDTICPDTACKSLQRGGTGNPSPITAIGVYHAAKAGAEFAFPDKTLKNKVVLLSGVGQVGYELAKNFIYNGVAKVICAEMSQERMDWVKKQFERMGKTDRITFMVYTKEELGSQKFLHDLANEIDIFAPCALGRSINDTNIHAIKGTRLKLICGAENNQLADEEKHGKLLQEMGIVYVPDYVANAGGLINAVQELNGRMFLLSEVVDHSKRIYDTTKKVLEMAHKEKIPTYLAANKLAESRFLKK